MSVPDPDECEIREIKIRDKPAISVHFPSENMGTVVKKDGIYGNINEMRREYNEDYEECANCDSNTSFNDTAGILCEECYRVTLDAAKEWAEEHTDELLGDEL